MIKSANGLSGVQDESVVQNNGVESCSNLQSCPTTTGGSNTADCSGKDCECDDKCNCTPTPTDNPNGVFKNLCNMMCCNGKEKCSCTDGNCQSIKTFCTQVKSFTDLVKEVKNGTATTSPTTTTPCDCKDKNCDFCKTCRFIKLIEEYTKELGKEHKCRCNKPDLIDAVIDITLDVGFTATKYFFNKFADLISGNGEQKNSQGTDGTAQGSNPKFYECKCCIDKNDNCLKDGRYMTYTIYSRPRVNYPQLISGKRRGR